jgi:mono/diheme cytochrome c family protein
MIARTVVIGLYNRYCGRCHGVDGRGMWDIAKVPNFTNPRWQASRSDEQLTRTIMEGLGACKPPSPGTLNLEEAWALVRFIRTFVPRTEAAPPQGIPPEKKGTLSK